MSKRDVVLSLCSLLLGASLGVSSLLYAQEVALSAPRTEDVRAGKFQTRINRKDFKGAAVKKRGISQRQERGEFKLKRASGTQQ